MQEKFHIVQNLKQQVLDKCNEEIFPFHKQHAHKLHHLFVEVLKYLDYLPKSKLNLDARSKYLIINIKYFRNIFFNS